MRPSHATAVVAVGCLALTMAACGTGSAVRATTSAPRAARTPPPSANTAIPQSAPPSSVPAGAYARISAQLTAWVAAEQTAETRAGMGSADNVWGTPVIAEASRPVRDGAGYIALAAFSFDRGGNPVKVLSYSRGMWTPTDGLAPPVAPGTIVHPSASTCTPAARGSPRPISPGKRRPTSSSHWPVPGARAPQSSHPGNTLLGGSTRCSPDRSPKVTCWVGIPGSAAPP